MSFLISSIWRKSLVISLNFITLSLLKMADQLFYRILLRLVSLIFTHDYIYSGYAPFTYHWSDGFSWHAITCHKLSIYPITNDIHIDRTRLPLVPCVNALLTGWLWLWHPIPGPWVRNSKEVSVLWMEQVRGIKRWALYKACRAFLKT